MISAAEPFDFFSSFEQLSDVLQRISKQVRELYVGKRERHVELVDVLKNMEHEADGITYRTLEQLNRTFITPIDREDIHTLITSLDDIADLMYAAGGRLLVYRPIVIPQYILDMTEIIESCVNELRLAVKSMRNPHERTQVIKHCIEVNRMENVADDKLREGLTHLFANETNPIELIKLKELVEDLEDTTDICEHVANLLEGIMLKHA